MLRTGGCNSWDLNSQVFSEELAYFCTNSLRLLTVVLSIYISSLQTAGKSKDALGFSKTLCVWSFGSHQGFMHGLSGKKKLNLLRILTWNTTEQCQKEKTLTSLDTHVINLIWSMIHWYRKEEKLKRYDAPEKYFICIITLLDRIWHQVIITSHPCKMMEPYSDSI